MSVASIFPPPSSKREAEIPETAVDSTAYPPYRLVWCLEVFSKKNGRMVAEVVLERFDVATLRRVFRRPPSDPMIEGGWPVTGKHREKIESLTGQRLNLARFSYYVAASALNYYEVNPAK